MAKVARTPRVPLLLSAMLAAGVVVGCGGGGDSGTAAAVVTPPAAVVVAENARYSITLVNALNGARITDPMDVVVTAGPTLKAMDGTTLVPGTKYRVTNGLFTLDAQFTAANTSFSITASDAGTRGWLPAGAVITGTAGAKGDFTAEVRLNNANNAAAVNASAAPVAMAVQTTTAAAGGVLAAVTVPTAPKTVTADDGTARTLGTAQVAISAGTRATTADGTPAAAGPISVATTFTAPTNAATLAALPGGFGGAVEAPAGILGGADAAAPAMVVGAQASFNVTDAAGNRIRRFDPAITLSMDVLKGTRRADGTLVAAGTTYPIFTFDEATGKWVYQTNGNVMEKAPVDPNNFKVEFTTTTLSQKRAMDVTIPCNVTYVFTGRPAGSTLPVRLLVSDASGIPGFARQVESQAATTDTLLIPALVGRAANIRVVNLETNTDLLSLTNQETTCTPTDRTRTVTVPVTFPTPPSGAIQVTANEQCSDGSNRRAVPNVAVSVGVRSRFTDATGAVTFTGVSPGSATVSAVHPDPDTVTTATQSTTVTVVNNQTVNAAFTYTLRCQVTTGGVSSPQ